MRRLAPKAFFTFLTLGRGEGKRINRERTVVIFSTAVTVGLVALYLYGKATSRW